jgi:hypothetical protein
MGGNYGLDSKAVMKLSIWLIKMPDGNGGTTPTYFWAVTQNAGSPINVVPKNVFGMVQAGGSFAYTVTELEIVGSNPPWP